MLQNKKKPTNTRQKFEENAYYSRILLSTSQNLLKRRCDPFTRFIK